MTHDLLGLQNARRCEKTTQNTKYQRSKTQTKFIDNVKKAKPEAKIKNNKYFSCSARRLLDFFLQEFNLI